MLDSKLTRNLEGPGHLVLRARARTSRFCCGQRHRDPVSQAKARSGSSAHRTKGNPGGSASGRAESKLSKHFHRNRPLTTPQLPPPSARLSGPQLPPAHAEPRPGSRRRQSSVPTVPTVPPSCPAPEETPPGPRNPGRLASLDPSVPRTPRGDRPVCPGCRDRAHQLAGGPGH